MILLDFFNIFYRNGYIGTKETYKSNFELRLAVLLFGSHKVIPRVTEWNTYGTTPEAD